MILSILLLSTHLLSGYDWVLPNGVETPTVYFQGAFESQRQCAKYCGSKGFTATTKEQVICYESQELILNPFIGTEIAEIMLKNSPSASLLNMWHHHAIFSWKGYRRGLFYEGTRRGDQSVSSHSVDYFKMNFGQGRDIWEHARKVDLCAKHYPNRSIILWGVSRGAATTLTALARHAYDHIALVVLEGCFDTLAHTLAQRGATSIAKKVVWSALEWLIKYTTEYQENGASPLNVIHALPEGIPFVFITSAKDTSVSRFCTQRVVDALKKRGKNPVHYLCLAQAGHNTYSLGNRPDQQKYMKFMHTIYKQYNLPYISQFT